MSQFDEAVRGDAISIRYVKELTKALNDLRKENQLCDIVINVGERAFNAHRGVLAASSSYFKAMLTSGFTEANQDVITIDGKAEHFEMLLQYIYTGKLDVSWTTSQDDICGILQMANYLLLMDAVSNCTSLIQDLYENFTVEQMPIKVAFKYLLVAKANDLMDLVKSSERRLQDNLMMLKKCKVFLEDASVEFMEEFLSGDNLATADEEEEVLMLVLEWLKFDWDNRRPHTYRLLQKVRLGLVPEDRCNELLDDSILAIPECKILIDKVDQLMDDDTVSEQVMALRKPELFATRSTVTAPVSIETRKYSLSYEKTYFRYYNAKKQVWEKMAGLDLFPFTFHARPEDKFFLVASSFMHWWK
ncbi:kelch-like protein 25 [Amphiura filiformis]|uniref:kelch-like protein 25 n=1 Tax=Amphiura filiformis TaxID=82378 RepID=UPI003B210738